MINADMLNVIKLDECKDALKAAKVQIITLHPSGDSRKLKPKKMQDGIQMAILDQIDKALED